jgi:hypothetical protein
VSDVCQFIGDDFEPRPQFLQARGHDGFRFAALAATVRARYG